MRCLFKTEQLDLFISSIEQILQIAQAKTENRQLLLTQLSFLGYHDTMSLTRIVIRHTNELNRIKWRHTNHEESKWEMNEIDIAWSREFTMIALDMLVWCTDAELKWARLYLYKCE